MEIKHNIDLTNYTTMRLPGIAKYFIQIDNKADLETAVSFIKKNHLAYFVLGGGSNTLIKSQTYTGLVILNRIFGKEIIESNDEFVIAKFGSGENWDDVVNFSVKNNLSGIEAMSGIPGVIGSAPVQNIGAYGQEISDSLIELEAYDVQQGKYTVLSNDDCLFGYRTSIFRDKMPKRFIITSVTLQLSHTEMDPPLYSSLQSYIESHKIESYTPSTIRQAVLDLRQSKLPDPSLIPNSGSFFKNPLINSYDLAKLISKFPSIKYYKMPNDLYKIPAGWLIEQAGFKDKMINGIQVYSKNSLVLVNKSAKSYNDLAYAKNQIIKSIQKKFNITIEQEPVEL